MLLVEQQLSRPRTCGAAPLLANRNQRRTAASLLIHAPRIVAIVLVCHVCMAVDAAATDTRTQTLSLSEIGTKSQSCTPTTTSDHSASKSMATLAASKSVSVGTATHTVTLSSDVTLSGSPTDVTETIRTTITLKVPTPTRTTTDTASVTASRITPSRSRSALSIPASMTPSSTVNVTSTASVSSSPTGSKPAVTETVSASESALRLTATATRPTPSTTMAVTVTRIRYTSSRSLTPHPTSSASVSFESTKSRTVTPPPTITPSISAQGSRTSSTSFSDQRSSTHASATSSSTPTFNSSATPQTSPSAGSWTITETISPSNTTTPPRTPTRSSSETANVTLTFTESVSAQIDSKSFSGTNDVTLSPTETFTEQGTMSVETLTVGTPSITRTLEIDSTTSTASITVSKELLPPGVSANTVATSDHVVRLGGSNWQTLLATASVDAVKAAARSDIARALALNESQVVVRDVAAGSLIVHFTVSRFGFQFIRSDDINRVVLNATFNGTSTLYRAAGFTDATAPIDAGTVMPLVVPPVACGNTCVIIVTATLTPVVVGLMLWFCVVRVRRWCHNRKLARKRRRRVRRYQRRHGSQPQAWYSVEPFEPDVAGDADEDSSKSSSQCGSDDDNGSSWTDASTDSCERRLNDLGYELPPTSHFPVQGDAGEEFDVPGGSTRRLFDDEFGFVGASVPPSTKNDSDVYELELEKPFTSPSAPPDSVTEAPPWVERPMRVPWLGRTSSEAPPPDLFDTDSHHQPAAAIEPHDAVVRETFDSENSGGSFVGNASSVCIGEPPATPLTTSVVAEHERAQTPPISPGITPRQHAKAIQSQRRLQTMTSMKMPPSPRRIARLLQSRDEGDGRHSTATDAFDAYLLEENIAFDVDDDEGDAEASLARQFAPQHASAEKYHAPEHRFRVQEPPEATSTKTDDLRTKTQKRVPEALQSSAPPQFTSADDDKHKHLLKVTAPVNIRGAPRARGAITTDVHRQPQVLQGSTQPAATVDVLPAATAVSFDVEAVSNNVVASAHRRCSSSDEEITELALAAADTVESFDLVRTWSSSVVYPAAPLTPHETRKAHNMERTNIMAQFLPEYDDDRERPPPPSADEDDALPNIVVVADVAEATPMSEKPALTSADEDVIVSHPMPHPAQLPSPRPSLTAVPAAAEDTYVIHVLPKSVPRLLPVGAGTVPMPPPLTPPSRRISPDATVVAEVRKSGSVLRSLRSAIADVFAFGKSKKKTKSHADVASAAPLSMDLMSSNRSALSKPSLEVLPASSEAALPLRRPSSWRVPTVRVELPAVPCRPVAPSAGAGISQGGDASHTVKSPQTPRGVGPPAVKVPPPQPSPLILSPQQSVQTQQEHREHDSAVLPIAPQHGPTVSFAVDSDREGRQSTGSAASSEPRSGDDTSAAASQPSSRRRSSRLSSDRQRSGKDKKKGRRRPPVGEDDISAIVTVEDPPGDAADVAGGDDRLQMAGLQYGSPAATTGRHISFRTPDDEVNISRL